VISKMSRAIWKKPFSNLNIFKLLHSNNIEKSIFFKFKNFIIFPSFTKIIFSIYNGKKFITIQIFETMFGFNIGEFIMTCKKTQHKNMKIYDKKKKYK